MTFSSENELRNFLLSQCRDAVAEVQEEIYNIIDSCLDSYYGEFTPAEYIRTKQLLYSLVLSEVRQTGNSITAEVYFDASSLHYQTGIVTLQSGRTGYATWSGEDVLESAMHGSHGGYASGTAIWGNSMSQIGNVCIKLLDALKARGIPIK